MKDAIAIHPGIVAVIAATVMQAIASHETITPTPLPVVELPGSESVTTAEPSTDSPCRCEVTGVTDPDQHRALELACMQYSDGVCSARFEVFSTATLGDLRAVFVRRPTGDCGGCGALTLAVIFRGNGVEVVDKLGAYGRFGNGPDAIRFVDVVGYPVIVVDNTISVGGFTDTSREYFVVDRRHVEWQLCLQIAGSDAGAREHASEWTSSNWIAAEGTMYFSPSYTRRGDVTPQLGAYSFQFKGGRWVRPEEEGDCVDPRLAWDERSHRDSWARK